MGQLERIKEARRAVQQAALERWRRRGGERERNKESIKAFGVGGADSPQRNARMMVREAGFEQARELRRQGRLPIGIERRMGPTLDYVPFAPSDAARSAGRPVARIVQLGGAGVQPEGIATGFLVAPGLLLTNHHVFPTQADAVGMGANFLFEQSDRGVQVGVLFALDPDTFYISDLPRDYAIVAVKPESDDHQALADFGRLSLIEATPKILIGEPVNIIQYPQGGPKQYAIKENRLIDILETEGFLHYETDTLEGSSGSPGFSQNWELVALHHASIPEVIDGKVIATNHQPWQEEMGDDQVHWIANEGTRISVIVKHLAGERLADPKKQEILDGLLALTTDPIDDLAKSTGTGFNPVRNENLPIARPGGQTMGGHQFNFSGPVTIHVYSPPSVAQGVPAAVPASRPAIELEKVIQFDQDYKGREGYSEKFLDPEKGRILVPVPTVRQARANEILTDSSGKPLVLKYHHFSLAMNKRRRLQMWSAANVDYDPSKKTSRERKELGTDKWIPDPRIPTEVQLVDKEFYKPAGKIDRGHIVRREDNAWGDSERDIEFANSDTFHWTNCTPQHEAFNRSSPGREYGGISGLWGSFENHIQEGLNDVDTKACILAGPVLSEEDPSADFGGANPIKYPILFWKIVAVTVTASQGAPDLRVFGFLLSQKAIVDRFGIEKFGPGRFKRSQVRLKDIEDAAGLEFAPSLLAADTMRNQPDPVEIRNNSEIRGL